MPIPQSKTLEINRHPSLVYWFWRPSVHQNREYVRHAQFLLNMTPFTHLGVTQRTAQGMGTGEDDFFPNTPHVQGHILESAEKCRELDCHLIVQYWWFPLPKKDGLSRVKPLVQMTYRGKFRTAGVKGEMQLLRVYAFDRVGRTGLRGSTIEDITDYCTVTFADGMTTVQGTDPAGKTDRWVQVQLRQSPDNYDPFAEGFASELKEYLSVFKGTAVSGFAIDEHTITATHEGFIYFYAPAAAKVYKELSGTDLIEDILFLHFRDLDDPTRQPKAIGHYLELIRLLNVEPERVMYDAAKEYFGEDAFVGFHDTYIETWLLEEYVECDVASDGLYREMWRHGFHHWELPRDYAQVDTINLYPLRLGLCRTTREPVWLSMFFAKGQTNLLELSNAAVFGGRIHWHAFPDKDGWALDLENDDRERETISRGERAIHLLNAVQDSQPRSDILVLMGYNSALSWRPELDDLHHRESFNFAHGLFRAGYVCDIVASYQAKKGLFKVSEDGRIQYDRATYKAVIWTGPQYDNREAIDLMKSLVDKNGSLWIVGTGGIDSDGRDVTEAWERIASGAKRRFERFPLMDEMVADLQKHGFNRGTDGSYASYIDGSVVWSDGNSYWENEQRSISLQTSAGMMQAKSLGLLAGKLDKEQGLEWVIAGECDDVKVDGKELVQLSEPCTFCIKRDGERMAIRAQSETNTLILGGSVQGVALPSLAAELQTHRDAGSVVVSSNLEFGDAEISDSTVRLQPLVDWLVAPDWSQDLSDDGHVEWKLTPGEDLIHRSADIQVLYELDVAEWHIELYVRQRIDDG